jgi:hypothetical protein
LLIGHIVRERENIIFIYLFYVFTLCFDLYFWKFIRKNVSKFAVLHEMFVKEKNESLLQSVALHIRHPSPNSGKPILMLREVAERAE